jgi:hypothetical protein
MTKKLLLMVAITIIVCTVGWSATRPLPTPDHAREELKVLKVFSAHDGDAVFREYLVKWKNQEVVVQDTLIQTNYQVGDTIPVLVIRNKYPQGQAGPDLLSFHVVPH